VAAAVAAAVVAAVDDAAVGAVADVRARTSEPVPTCPRGCIGSALRPGLGTAAAVSAEPTVGAGPPTEDRPTSAYLHIGAPKTGSTALQHLLWHNRYHLARRGVCYPLERMNEHVDATMDIRGDPLRPAGPATPSTGAWDEVATRIRDWPGPQALFSSEILGAANPDRIGQVVASLRPADVHLIMTVRSLARQMPSDWQEQIKHGRTVSLGAFVKHLVEGGVDRGPRYTKMFWRQHDPAYVLATWSAFVPADHIHLVIAPAPGGPRLQLFERFFSVLGVTLQDLCVDIDLRANASLGLAEAELVRRLNPGLTESLGPSYGHLVRDVLAERVLSQRTSEPRIVLPRPYAAWVAERSADIVSRLRASSYDVVGDLDELLDGGPPGGPDVPTALTESELTPAAYDAITGLLTQIGTLQGRVDQLLAQVNEVEPAVSPQPLEPTVAPAHGPHGVGPAYRTAGDPQPPLGRMTEDADAGRPPT
jgi:hypothetical protein